jgi:hypothetical protein
VEARAIVGIMAGSEASAPKRARIDASEDVRETSGCGAEGGAAAAAAVEGALSVHAVGDSPPPVYPYASPSAAAVLLIGDGNLSFGAALVRQRGGGSGVIVTSFESHDELVGKYKETKGLIAELVAAGARVAHSVDATRLPQSLWDAGVDKVGGCAGGVPPSRVPGPRHFFVALRPPGVPSRGHHAPFQI